MSQILYKVESTEQYDSHVVGIYSNIEDANKRLAMVCLGEVMYTSYAIYEMVIDLNVEKLREGYHTFQFDRQRTERGVKVSVYENYSELNERFHYSPNRKIERISILARNMREPSSRMKRPYQSSRRSGYRQPADGRPGRKNLYFSELLRYAESVSGYRRCLLFCHC